jgi:hypothetical protein
MPPSGSERYYTAKGVKMQAFFEKVKIYLRALFLIVFSAAGVYNKSRKRKEVPHEPR